MNLIEASIVLNHFHRAHPETKDMTPEQVSEFVLSLSELERRPIEEAGQCIADEARAAVEILTGRKLTR